MGSSPTAGIKFGCGYTTLSLTSKHQLSILNNIQILKGKENIWEIFKPGRVFLTRFETPIYLGKNKIKIPRHTTLFYIGMNPYVKSFQDLEIADSNIGEEYGIVLYFLFNGEKVAFPVVDICVAIYGENGIEKSKETRKNVENTYRTFISYVVYAQ